MDATVILFDDWEQVLKIVLSPTQQQTYHEAIIKSRYLLGVDVSIFEQSVMMTPIWYKTGAIPP